MKRKSFVHIKKILLDSRNEMQYMLDMANHNKKEESFESQYPTHMADLGSDTLTLENNSYSASRMVKYLNSIDAALQRIEQGEYGLCVECGKEIPLERLKLVPVTRRCVQCKSESGVSLLGAV